LLFKIKKEPILWNMKKELVMRISSFFIIIILSEHPQKSIPASSDV
jgi:hypothetical protein